jgi:hypothetical protein
MKIIVHFLQLFGLASICLATDASSHAIQEDDIGESLTSSQQADEGIGHGRRAGRDYRSEECTEWSVRKRGYAAKSLQPS